MVRREEGPGCAALRRIDAGGVDFSQTLGNFLGYSVLKSSEKLKGTIQIDEIRIAATPR